MIISYIVSRFPKISETFILNEMLGLRRRGVGIRLYPLMRANEPCRHPDVEAMLPYTHYLKLRSPGLVADHIRFLFEQPRRYLGTWGVVFRGYARSPARLPHALAVMLKAVHMAGLMRREGTDCVHAHWATYPALCAFIIKRLTGIPYSFTTHAHDIFVDRTMLREKMEQARFVTTISAFNRRFLIEKIGDCAAEKVRVVRLGVDLERFSAANGSYKTSPFPFRIVCLAALEDKKGHPYLLEACRLLKERAIPLFCQCIGDGDARASIENRIAELGLEPEVKLLGFLPSAAVRHHLADAHCMVLPSIITGRGKMEGIPVAIMEAMAMQVPVVSTAISGIPEIITSGINGILVEPANAAALADAIHRIYQSPALAKSMGEAARRTVEKDYNLDKNIGLLHDLLESA